jgi:hypothetical protein
VQDHAADDFGMTDERAQREVPATARPEHRHAVEAERVQ